MLSRCHAAATRGFDCVRFFNERALQVNVCTVGDGEDVVEHIHQLVAQRRFAGVDPSGISVLQLACGLIDLAQLFAEVQQAGLHAFGLPPLPGFKLDDVGLQRAQIARRTQLHVGAVGHGESSGASGGVQAVPRPASGLPCRSSHK